MTAWQAAPPFLPSRHHLPGVRFCDCASRVPAMEGISRPPALIMPPSRTLSTFETTQRGGADCASTPTAVGPESRGSATLGLRVKRVDGASQALRNKRPLSRCAGVSQAEAPLPAAGARRICDLTDDGESTPLSGLSTGTSQAWHTPRPDTEGRSCTLACCARPAPKTAAQPRHLVARIAFRAVLAKKMPALFAVCDIA